VHGRFVGDIEWCQRHIRITARHGSEREVGREHPHAAPAQR